MTCTETAFDVLQNLGPKQTNQIKGMFPARSATTRNVIELSKFRCCYKSIVHNFRRQWSVTKKVVIHCSQLMITWSVKEIRILKENYNFLPFQGSKL